MMGKGKERMRNCFLGIGSSGYKVQMCFLGKVSILIGVQSSY